MSLEQTFCSSPWIHLRIRPDGSYEYCRWVSERSVGNPNINNVAPVTFFREHMSEVRKGMLMGTAPSGCAACHRMEQYHKVSGRQRQLLKTGIRLENFAATAQSSPYYAKFLESLDAGDTDVMPVDWQIDLGNYCNGACVFCGPASSSRLATEFKRIGIHADTVPRNWTDDPASVQLLVDTLVEVKSLRYLHFIGGETLLTPAFKQILSALVDHGLTGVTLGFTTNLLVWDDAMVDLLKNFKEVNLGLSIESFAPVNDYARWPATHATVQPILRRWLDLGKSLGWITQIRTTPTALTIETLHTVFDFAFKEGVSVESCNFLERPAFMRASVLPAEIKQTAAQNIRTWIESTGIIPQVVSDVNTRNPAIARQQIVQDATSYLHYLESAPDETHMQPELAAYLSKIDRSRNISVFDYLPHYEEFLRASGYTY